MRYLCKIPIKNMRLNHKKRDFMKLLKTIGACLIGLVLTMAAHGQSIEAGKVVIKYDPLFWKDQLKLTSDQYSKIKRINHEYYQKLLTAANSSKSSNGTMHVKVEEYLEQRSAEIWSTFRTKQKRKWMKLWGENFEKLR
jgi:hypothetical protein